jgi:UDP-glucose 4-epimerase
MDIRFERLPELAGKFMPSSQVHLEMYSGKTVLVTGGAGAIGSNLTAALSKHGGPEGKVIVIDNLVASARWNVPSYPNVIFVEGDILDEVKRKRCFFEKPDMIFHLAAFFANQNSIDHPENDLMVNGMGTLRLMEYSAIQGLDRFLYASSGCSIYVSIAPLPLTENFMSMHLDSITLTFAGVLGVARCEALWSSKKLLYRTLGVVC